MFLDTHDHYIIYEKALHGIHTNINMVNNITVFEHQCYFLNALLIRLANILISNS